MAIDTAEKRRSAAMVGVLGIIAGPGVTPNADADKEWRQQVGYGYSGIAVGAGGLSPWWMLPSPLSELVRAEPRVLILLLPGELVFSLVLRAQGWAIAAPTPMVVASRGVCVILWATSATRPWLTQLQPLSASMWAVNLVGRGALVAMAKAKTASVLWRLEALGQEYWPYEAQELRLLGFRDFLTDEEDAPFPELAIGRRKGG